jgi:hypothetical protein
MGYEEHDDELSVEELEAAAGGAGDPTDPPAGENTNCVAACGNTNCAAACTKTA